MKYSVNDLLTAIVQLYGSQRRNEAHALASRIELERRIAANQTATNAEIARANEMDPKQDAEIRDSWLRTHERITLLFAKHKKLMAEYEALP